VGDAIEASGLEKTFVKRRSIRELIVHPLRRPEYVRALRGVDLRVAEGEIFGLLGPNGAGKTTLLKILSCLVLPDAGEALVGGRATTRENEVKRKIGLVHSDERSFYWRLSARENLRFFARLYDVPGPAVEDRIETLLRRVDMDEAADRPFSEYSSGMKQRISIARALLHDPPILLMDEPTRSLDPASSLALREFIFHELSRKEGKTILLATHNLREAEVLADRIAILVRGRVRQTGTVDEVRRWGVREQRYRLELGPSGSLPAGPFRVVEDESGAGSRRVLVSLDEGARLEELLRAVLGSGCELRGCDRVEPDLEEAFSRILRAGEDGA
jgi:ABC-2 type transport system ATP-binding protein